MNEKVPNSYFWVTVS